MTLPRLIDSLIVLFLMLLVVILPVAETNALRYFFFISAVFLWILKVILNEDHGFFKTELDTPFGVYTGIALMSALGANDFYESLSQFKGEVLEVFLLFFLVAKDIKTEREKKLLYSSLMIGLLIMVSYGLWDYFITNKVGILSR